MTNANETYFVMTRTFSLPPEEVFDAWMEKSQVSQWLSCGPDYAFDVRQWSGKPGDPIAVDVTGPDGDTVTVRGRFLTVDRPDKFEYLWGDERVVVEFKKTPDGTVMTLTHHMSDPDNDDMRRTLLGGWTHSLGRLCSYIKPFEEGARK